MKAILAVDAHTYAYSKGQGLIYWCAGDLRNFRRVTSAGDDPTVVMGRRTYLTLPATGLPNRTNYVVTSNPYPSEHANVQFVSYDWMLANAKPHWWLIGGAILMWHALDDDAVDEVLLTEISRKDGTVLSSSQYDMDVAWMQSQINNDGWTREVVDEFSDVDKYSNAEVDVWITSYKKTR